MLILARQVVAVHVKKLGANQAEAHRAVGGRLLEFDGQLDIGFEGNFDAIAGHRRQPAQPVQIAPFAGQRVAPGFVLGDRFGRRVNDHRPLGAIDDDGRLRACVLDQIGHSEHRRHAERARDDRRMAVGAAELGGKAGDALRVHQRGVGRGQFVGDNDRTLGHARIGGVGFLDQIADQTGADDADILAPRR